MALADGFSDLVHIKWTLGDENGVGASGDAAVERDPSSVPAHDFHDHHAVVSFGGGVHAVDGFADDVARGIEAEGIVGSAEVVVDGFRHSHNVYALLVQFLRDGKCIVAADRNQGIDFVGRNGFYAAIEAVGTLGGIGTRSAQNGSPAGQNAAHRVQIQFHALVLNQAAPTFHESHELVVVVKHSFAHYRADHRVQPRTIAAAGQDANLHRLLLNPSIGLR